MNKFIQYLKGPGLIVVVLLVGVVSAFSLRGMMGSEGMLGGNEALKQEIADKQKRLKTLEDEIQQALDEQKAQKESLVLMEQLDDVRLQMLEIKQSNQDLRAKLGSLEKGLEETHDLFESYKDRYREAIRKAAVGTKHEKLTLLDGKVYRGVEIRVIDPLGMNITHQEGSCRIPYKQLPEEMQERFQFDAQQADEKRRAERARQRQRWMTLQLGDDASSQKHGGKGSGGRKADELEEAIAELQAAVRAVDRKLAIAKRKRKDEIVHSTGQERQYRQQIDKLEALRSKYEEQIRELRATR
jgi:hypothetical protein